MPLREANPAKRQALLGRVKKDNRVILEYVVDGKKKRVVKSIVVTE